MTEKYTDEFIERHVDVGRAQGKAEGRAQGRAEGKAEGAVEAKITNILRVLSIRDLRPTKKQLSRLAACTDPAALDRWFVRSVTAETAAEIFTD